MSVTVVETTPKSAGAREFLLLTAFLMALYTVAIDSVLPALGMIGNDFAVANVNYTQLALTALFGGMAIGQLFYGPLSDAIGRKAAINIGLGFFALGTLICLVAPDFESFLAGRALQGLGAASPRIVTVAIFRDRGAGAEMARQMSFMMTIFVMLPVCASFLAQGAILVLDWHVIFIAQLAFALVMGSWLHIRQPETLPESRRTAFSFAPIWRGVAAITTSRAAMPYILATGFMFGAVFAFAGSARQVYQDLYGVGALMPVCFAITALAFGSATLFNARLVRLFDLHKLAIWAALGGAVVCSAFFLYVYLTDNTISLIAYIALSCLMFVSVGLLHGNLTTLAMQPYEHMAGLAAGIIGSITWIVALTVGAIIGQAFDGTVTPLLAGYALSSWLVVAMILQARS